MYPKGKKNEWPSDELRFNYPLNENSIVLDLGGYEGWFSSVITNKYNCKVYCFEPVSRYYEMCKNRLKNYNNVKLYKTGLAGTDSVVGFSVQGDASSMHYGIAQETVQLKKIDDFLKEENIETVDLMKMNIEGAEYELLEYIILKKIIKKFKNIQIQFHENPYDGWKEKYEFVIENLNLTHHLTYQYEFKFENWKINE